jgi:hypothetical protein
MRDNTFPNGNDFVYNPDRYNFYNDNCTMDYHGTANDDQIDQDKLAIPAGTVIYGGDGNDTLSASDALLIGGRGNDTLIATGNWATAAYWDSPAGVTVDLGKGVAQDGFGTTDKLVGIRTVQGSSHDDTLIGGSANEFFYGGGGNNTIIGGEGFDTVDYFFVKSTEADISYDAVSDTFTVVRHFANGDRGTDKLTGIEKIEFTGDGSDHAVILRSQFVGDFRPASGHPQVTLPAGMGVSQFKAGDFNGDGHTDFAFVSQAGTGTAPAPTYLFAGDGNGGFSDATTVLLGAVPMKVVGGGRTLVGDFNNDGHSDIFQLDFGDDAVPFNGGISSLYLSTPGGTLADASATLPQRPDLNHGASVGDVNGDGYADVLVNTLNYGNYLLINDGTGHFREMDALLPRPVDRTGAHQTNTFSGIIDVNSDGAPDIVLGAWDGDSLHMGSQVLLNDGHGNFTKTAPITLPASGIDKEIILAATAIDLNGDAFPDLMLSVTNGGDHDVFYHAAYIQLLVGDGSGHFRDETATRLPQGKDTSTFGWLMSLTSVDFNHDGHPDIMAESAGWPITSKVYLNKGDGTFALDWEAGIAERAIVADADSDGMSDVVTATDLGTVTISLNKLANGHIYQANFGGDTLLGSAGNDTFYARSGVDVFDGADGFDTAVFAGARSAYTVHAAGPGYQLTAPGSSATLTNIERVQFSDGVLAFDLNGTAGQAYRVYQAAFDRAPDQAGLGYWIGAMDKGMTLVDVAAQFVASAEFSDRYAKLDGAAFLTTVYHNVLHREPDAAGLDFWVGYMNGGGSRAGLLAQFSESHENQVQVIGSIGLGIGYQPYH